MSISSVTQAASDPGWWTLSSAASTTATATTASGPRNGSGSAINAGTGANPFAIMASELQSLLVQLQGGTSSATKTGATTTGATAARATSAGTTPATAAAAADSTAVSHGHGRHHHVHGGPADPSAQYSATTMIDELTGTSASGSTATGAGSSGTDNGSGDLLTNFASAALSGSTAA